MSAMWMLGRPPADHPPSTPYVRVDRALGAGLIAAVAGYAIVALLQWWPLPWSPNVPPGGLWRQLADYPLVLSSYVLPHKHWLYDNPAYDARSVDALHARLAPALLVALIVGVGAIVRGLRPICRLRHLDGPRLRHGDDALQALHAAIAIESKDTRPFLSLAGVPLAKSRWTRGVLFYGSPGSGKTQAILPIVDQLINANHRSLIYDVKADFSAAFLGKNGTVALFSPWDERSLVWDLAADCRSPSDAQIMASAMVPSGDERNAYFTNAASALLEGCLISLQNELPGRWTWGELARRLSSDRETWAERLHKHHPSALALIGREGEQADNVLSSVSSYCKPIFDLAMAWPSFQRSDGSERPRISFRAWAEDGYAGNERQILLQAGPNAVLNQTVYGAVFHLLTPRLLTPALPDDEMGRTLAFVLDELPSLGAIPFAELIERGRSKGIVFVGGCQALDQIEEVWGTSTKNSLGSMIGTHVVGRLQPSASRETIADLMGKQRVAITAVSVGVSGEGISVHEESRNAIHAYQLTEMLGPRSVPRSTRFPEGFCSRMLLSGIGPDLLTIDFPGVRFAARALPHIPAPWTLEPLQSGQHEPEAGTLGQGLERTAEDAATTGQRQPAGATVKRTVRLTRRADQVRASALSNSDPWLGQ